MVSKDDIFVKVLLDWFKTNKRIFPWREETLTPFQVLIAELMLQKTNANQVLKIYPDFIKNYPNPRTLDELDESILVKMLQPLGLFNRRARDLKKLVKKIIKDGGYVPDNKEELMVLPGIGDYIANAILCFAYHKKVPIIDANVGRVMKRVYLFPVKSAPSRDKELTKKMEKILPEENFRIFNYAILDFAALICLARNPKCDICPLSSTCEFYQGGEYNEG